MKNLTYLFASGLLMAGLVACGGSQSQNEQASNTSTTTNTAVASAPKSATPPFAIPDSSIVKNLEGGVKLYILRQGTGIAPTLESKVLANYHGRLANGDVFDSSYERKSPTEFPLNGVIKGWQVAFKELLPGAQAVIVIPAAMGYGDRAQAKIPANSTLIFDVEFITTM